MESWWVDGVIFAGNDDVSCGNGQLNLNLNLDLSRIMRTKSDVDFDWLMPLVASWNR